MFFHIERGILRMVRSPSQGCPAKCAAARRGALAGSGVAAMRPRNKGEGAFLKRRPVIALTMGDPAGVGPEVCLKAVRDARVQARCVPPHRWRHGGFGGSRPADAHSGPAGAGRGRECAAACSGAGAHARGGLEKRRSPKPGVRKSGARAGRGGGPVYREGRLDGARRPGGRHDDGADKQGIPARRGLRLPGTYRDARRLVRRRAARDDAGPPENAHRARIHPLPAPRGAAAREAKADRLRGAGAGRRPAFAHPQKA